MLKSLALAFLLLTVMPLSAGAVAVDKPLKDPALEVRARDLHKQLRCLVCQNQSIEDSNAELARDLRRLVREQVAAGRTDAEVLNYVVARYGDWVLLEPPLNKGTLALWFGPPLILLLAMVMVMILIRRRKRRPEAIAVDAPLDDEKSRQLAAILTPKDAAGQSLEGSRGGEGK